MHLNARIASQFLGWVICVNPSGRSLEVEGLVGGEESHELWHRLNTDHTGFVDVEVSPGSWEVGLEVLGLGWSIKGFCLLYTSDAADE